MPKIFRSRMFYPTWHTGLYSYGLLTILALIISLLVGCANDPRVNALHVCEAYNGAKEATYTALLAHKISVDSFPTILSALNAGDQVCNSPDVATTSSANVAIAQNALNSLVVELQKSGVK